MIYIIDIYSHDNKRKHNLLLFGLIIFMCVLLLKEYYLNSSRFFSCLRTCKTNKRASYMFNTHKKLELKIFLVVDHLISFLFILVPPKNKHKSNI